MEKNKNLIKQCPTCGNEMEEELAGTLTADRDYTYIRIYCACCGEGREE